MERLVAFVLHSFFEYLHTLEGADHFWHSSEAIIPREKMQQVRPGTSYIVIKHTDLNLVRILCITQQLELDLSFCVESSQSL